MSWGYELIIDCKGGDKEAVSSHDNIADFVRDLVGSIDMVAYGDPLIVHFAEHDPTKAGFSLCQLITTSSITGHFVDMNGDFYLNIFSCKPFSETTAIRIVDKWFMPQDIKSKFVNRG